MVICVLVKCWVHGCATFLNTSTGEAMRIAGLDETRKLADERYPAIAGKSRRQFLAYREAADEDLFKVEKVAVHYTDFDRRVDLARV